MEAKHANVEVKLDFHVRLHSSGISQLLAMAASLVRSLSQVGLLLPPSHDGVRQVNLTNVTWAGKGKGVPYLSAVSPPFDLF